MNPNRKKIQIDDNLMQRLSELSLLEFNEEEYKKIKKDLEGLINFCNQINNFDTTKYNTTTTKHINKNVYRDDINKTTLSKNEALKLATNKTADFFIVPKVIEK